MKRSRGKKASEAELLFAKWLRLRGWIAHRAAATGMKKLEDGAGNPIRDPRTGKPRFVVQSHDIWGCIDVVAFKPTGDVLAAQVTTQEGRNARRRKLEGLPWPADPKWRVVLVSHEAVEDPAHRARRLHFWKVERLTAGTWKLEQLVPFSPTEVEAHAREKRAAEVA